MDSPTALDLSSSAEAFYQAGEALVQHGCVREYRLEIYRTVRETLVLPLCMERHWWWDGFTHEFTDHEHNVVGPDCTHYLQDVLCVDLRYMKLWKRPVHPKFDPLEQEIRDVIYKPEPPTPVCDYLKKHNKDFHAIQSFLDCMGSEGGYGLYRYREDSDHLMEPYGKTVRGAAFDYLEADEQEHDKELRALLDHQRLSNLLYHELHCGDKLNASQLLPDKRVSKQHRLRRQHAYVRFMLELLQASDISPGYAEEARIMEAHYTEWLESHAPEKDSK